MTSTIPFHFVLFSAALVKLAKSIPIHSLILSQVLGKLPVPGRPTIWIIVGQGPTTLAVGAGGGCLDIFTLIYPFFPLSPSLWETARYRLKYCLKGPLNPKQPTNQPSFLLSTSSFSPFTVPCRIVLAKPEDLETTRECISFTFGPRDVLLSLQISYSFVRAAVAYAILERTSVFEPSSGTISPRYLKLVTVTSFCPFTLTSLWMSLALFVISLVFSAQISVLYLVQVLSRLSIRVFSSCSSSARANRQTADWYYFCRVC